MMGIFASGASAVVFGLMWDLKTVIPLLGINPAKAVAATLVADNISWWFVVFGGTALLSLHTHRYTNTER